MHCTIIMLVICLILLSFNAESSPVNQRHVHSGRLFRKPAFVEVRSSSLPLIAQQAKRNGHLHPVADSPTHQQEHLYQKRLTPTSEDVTIKDVTATTTKPKQTQPLVAESSYQPRVICEAAKTSKWLLCENASGDMKREEAEQVCLTHAQTLWMFVPAGDLLKYTYWICARPNRILLV